MKHRNVQAIKKVIRSGIIIHDAHCIFSDNLVCWSNFELSALTRQEGKGAKTELTYLRFSDENRIYTVYQEYQASNQQEFVGLRIEEPAKGIMIEQNGDAASVLGNLSALRFEKRIRQSRL